MIQICKACNSLEKKTILLFFAFACLKFDIAGTKGTRDASEVCIDINEGDLII